MNPDEIFPQCVVTEMSVVEPTASLPGFDESPAQVFQAASGRFFGEIAMDGLPAQAGELQLDPAYSEVRAIQYGWLAEDGTLSVDLERCPTVVEAGLTGSLIAGPATLSELFSVTVQATSSDDVWFGLSMAPEWIQAEAEPSGGAYDDLSVVDLQITANFDGDAWLGALSWDDGVERLDAGWFAFRAE